MRADEVVVLQRDALELERDFEQRVLAGDGEDEVGDPLDDLRARIVRLVDAVAESHQPVAASPDFTFLMNSGTLLDRADLVEHPQHRFVRAAVQRAVERRRPRRPAPSTDRHASCRWSASSSC